MGFLSPIEDQIADYGLIVGHPEAIPKRASGKSMDHVLEADFSVPITWPGIRPKIHSYFIRTV
jgi:hypothetical protein